MIKQSIFVLSTIMLFTSLVMAGPGLVISEVLFNEPGGSTTGEWIEIFNPTVNSINLTNYKLRTNADTYTIPIGTIINAGDVLVFAKKLEQPGFIPDFIDMGALALLNGGEKVELFNASNTIIDFVAWEDFITNWDLDAGDGKSITRIVFPTHPDSWLSDQTPSPGSTSLTTVPEPDSIILLGCSLILFGFMRRLKTKHLVPLRHTSTHQIKNQF